MFWRLFATYLALVAAAVLCVGALAVGQAGPGLVVSLAAAAAAIVPLSALPAYLLARRFTLPLEQLTESARRVTDGDFAHRATANGSREVATLAAALNELSARLGRSFADMGRDREQLRTILSGMVEGVIAFDAAQEVLFANDRAAQLLGFQPDRAVGRRLADVAPQQGVRDAAARGLRGDAPYRVELDGPGGDEKSLAVYVAPLPPRASGAHGAIMVLHDITELRRLERLRQDFVANVSHELKTPLANIKSSVEVLLDGAADEPAARGGFLAEIDAQADRLGALVADLLSIARVESGDIRLEFEAVAVEDAAHACLDRHRTRAEAKGMRLDGVALAGCPPELAAWADEEALAQVLDNLVDNAIKYTPENGRITVRWQASAQHVCFEVEDTGAGIPAADLPRVFERFYRVDKARSREKGGTGLGLAIVKHMVQVMHGTVRVESTVGQGTTFRVCLPRAGG